MPDYALSKSLKKDGELDNWTPSVPGVYAVFDEEEVLLAPLSRVGMAALEVEEDNGKREREEEEVVEEEAAPTQDLKRARLADY